MPKHSTKSSGGSSKTKKARRSTPEESSGSSFIMDRYLQESHRHEQIAIGGPSDKSITKEDLMQWDQVWQAASERKD
ncbi:hypothetical protein F5Y13DRAFT_191383 [Hypoxylon sp. FL1857]|nr:hypothetical protein F5Y13DRAFT_191383 [Hypoxylon sp. FL1857]